MKRDIKHIPKHANFLHQDDLKNRMKADKEIKERQNIEKEAEKEIKERQNIEKEAEKEMKERQNIEKEEEKEMKE